MQKPDSTELIIGIIAVTVLFLVLASFIVAFLLVFMRKRKEHLHERMMREAEFQKELLKAQLEIQEQTMKNISQEIHDNIGQVLSLAKMNLSKFEIDRANSDEAVLSAKQLVSKAVSDLRDLSKTLNTDTISTIGFMKAIELELQLVEKTTGIKTEMQETGNSQTLPSQQELILFRIVQESLHNSIKHASASLLSLKANWENEKFHLTVADNGKGFDFSKNAHGEGSGLHNMKSRSKLIGAVWQLESALGKGTQIHIIIPLNQKKHGNAGVDR